MVNCSFFTLFKKLHHKQGNHKNFHVNFCFKGIIQLAVLVLTVIEILFNSHLIIHKFLFIGNIKNTKLRNNYINIYSSIEAVEAWNNNAYAIRLPRCNIQSYLG